MTVETLRRRLFHHVLTEFNVLVLSRAVGGDRGHRRERLQDLAVPAHPVLWKPRGLVSLYFVIYLLFQFAGQREVFISNADATFTAFIELLSLWRVVNMSVRIFQLMCVSSAVRAKQQAKMAEYCRTIFGDALLIDPLEKYPVSWPAVRSDSALLHTTWSVHVNSHQGLCSVSNSRPVSVLLLKEKCKKHAWFWVWFWFYSSQGSRHRTGLLYISVSTSWNLQPFHYVCSLNAQRF